MNEKNTYTKLGDTVIGSKIYCEARKMSKITPIPGSSSHRTKRFSISTAKCKITRQLEWVKESTDTPQNIADEHDD